MEITNVVSKLPSVGSLGRRLFKDIKYAVFHHDAVLTGETYDPVQKYHTEADYHIKKGWKHLSYHLRIARNGQVFQTLPFEEIGYHAGNYKYNRAGIGICLDGDFTKQAPSPAQLTSLRRLMTHLATERPDLPLLLRKGFYSHKEVRLLPTSCPSALINQIVKDFRNGK